MISEGKSWTRRFFQHFSICILIFSSTGRRFSFSHSVFERHVLQTSKNQCLFEKGLRMVLCHLTAIASLCYLRVIASINLWTFFKSYLCKDVCVSIPHFLLQSIFLWSKGKNSYHLWLCNFVNSLPYSKRKHSHDDKIECHMMFSTDLEVSSTTLDRLTNEEMIETKHLV